MRFWATRPEPNAENARREIVARNGCITVPLGSPKILIQTRQGRCVGIYYDQPAKVLMVKTQDDPPGQSYRGCFSPPASMDQHGRNQSGGLPAGSPGGR
jgi:hypothetical protein